MYRELSRTLSLLGLAILMTALAPAQRMVVHDANYAYHEVESRPGGGGTTIGFFGSLQTTQVPFYPDGATAFDNLNGILYTTDGTTIEPMSHPAYAPVPVPASFPVDLPFLGPISGMTFDPATGGLWVTDGIMLAQILPQPGTPMMSPPIPLAGPIPYPPPAVGLDRDPFTGNFWIVDIIGQAHSFALGFNPMTGLQQAFHIATVPPPAGAPGAQPGGIAVDRTAANAGLWVAYPGQLVEQNTGAVTVAGNPFSQPHGLAFHAGTVPLTVPGLPNPGPCGCPGTGQQVTLGVNSPSYSGNAGFALGVSRWQFFQTFLGIDVVAAPPVPFGGPGCFLHLSPASPTFVFLPIPTGGNSTFVLPASLAGVPAGAQFFVQSLMVCQGGFGVVTGIAMSSALQITVARP